MKRSVLICLSLLLAAVLMCGIAPGYAHAEENAAAQTVREGDFTFEITGDCAKLLTYHGTAPDVTIPGSIQGVPVTVIGNEAFCDNDTLKTVTFPASVESIEDGDFVINQYLTYDAFGAFARCDALETVIFPEDSCMFYFGQCAFADSSLAYITLPDSTRELAYSCFYGTNLTELTLNEGLESIGQNVFSYTGIRTIHLPASCHTFNYYFSCETLESITVAEDSPYYMSHEGVLYSTRSSRIILTVYPSAKPGDTYRVADFCNYVRGDNFATSSPQFLKKLDIRDCDGWNLHAPPVEIIVSETNPYFVTENRMLFSKDRKKLIQLSPFVTGTVTVPDGVEVIGLSCASYCNYSKIIIPDTVTTIEDQAFMYTPSLTEVLMPDTVTELGCQVFQGCTALTRVKLSDSLKILRWNTFLDCTALEELILPSALETIEWQAMSSCNLKRLYIPASVTAIGSEAISINYDGHIIYGGSEEQWNQIHIEEQFGSTFYEEEVYHYNWPLNEDTDGHDYEINLSIADCERGDTATYTCMDCGHTYSEEEENALGHDWSEWRTVTYPTLTSEGEELHICNRYNCWKIEYRSIPKREEEGSAPGGSEPKPAPEETQPQGPEETQPTEEPSEPKDEPLENPFEDVSEEKFYYKPVMWAYYGGITTGKDATHFNPSGDCTRSQVVTFLWRAAGEPEPKSLANPFPDVPEGKFYTKAVLWAVEQGITAGYKDGTFGPNDACTRGQIVTFLWRYFDEPEPKSLANPFPDVLDSKFYYKAVLWAVENGITGGFKDGTFGPNKTCKRDQIVTFLYRAMVE